MRIILSVGGLLATASLCGCASEYAYVPDAATARKIACNVIHARFPRGRGDCSDMAVELKDGVWYVETDLHGGIGGGPNVEIAQKDGQILTFYVTQ
jgi:hypothetical protein